MMCPAFARGKGPRYPRNPCPWIRAHGRCDNAPMDTDGLADFLRRHREALTHADLGLPPPPRRRTPGLRREEVAALARISTDFYERLEQRRGGAPSRKTVGALARALRLTAIERSHLYELAGHAAPPQVYRTDYPSPELLRVLSHLDTPAQIVTDLGATLHQNAMAVALVGVQTDYDGLNRSIIYRWFTDPAQRRIYHPDDHDAHSRNYVAALRAVHGRSADDPEADELVERLLGDSDEFAALWNLHEVADRVSILKRYVHPRVGVLTLDCVILTSGNLTERLIIFTAAPGSQDADRLKLLSVIDAPRPDLLKS
jgi:hypothetical protein